MVKAFAFLTAHPARVRALVFAVLVLSASFVPGLPVDLIDAVVVALLALASGEGAAVHARRKAP